MRQRPLFWAWVPNPPPLWEGWFLLWEMLRPRAAVAYSGTTQSAKGTGTSLATASITISGSNPVLAVGITFEKTAAQAISSVTFGGTGTVASVATVTSSDCVAAGYCVIAPGSSGVVTVNMSASAAIQMSASLFTGADQTDPCPTGDAQTSTSAATPLTQTPTNLAAGDATYGCQGHTIASDCTGVTPNEIYRDSTTNVNFQTGYATDTTGTTYTRDSASGNAASVAFRIKQAGAAAATGLPPGVGTDAVVGFLELMGLYMAPWRRRGIPFSLT